MTSTPPRDFRDRVRAEADRLRDIVSKESKLPVANQRRHIIDGLNVAQQVLRKLAAEWASEAQRDEILAVIDSDD